MKIAWKIFFAAYFIVLLTVGIGGLIFVKVTAASMIDSRIETVLTSNEYAGKMFFALAKYQRNTGPSRKNGKYGSN